MPQMSNSNGKGPSGKFGLKSKREAEPVVTIGSKCKMSFKILCTSMFDMSASIETPTGQVEDEAVTEQSGYYTVNFVPRHEGVHLINVKYKGVDIPGSPFPFTVGPIKETGAKKVRAGGPGLERAICGEKTEFNVWTREAGQAGYLTVSIEGASKSEIDFIDRKDGTGHGVVTYTVAEPGDYRISVKFQDEHISGSPFKVTASKCVPGAKKVEITGLPPESLCKVNSPVNFNLNMNGAKGKITATTIDPEGDEISCSTMKVDDEQWAVRFIPKDEGVHRVTILLDGCHIPESGYAFKINPETVLPPPGRRSSISPIPPVSPGGRFQPLIPPSSPSFRLQSPTSPGPGGLPKGFTQSFDRSLSVEQKPLPDNRHLLPKYASVSTMVDCRGPGLMKAFMNRQNTFQVHAEDAGDNFLYVAVLGPKGPVDMVDIRHQGKNNYNVTYLSGVRGVYLVVVKYGEDMVPGSPFAVECVLGN